MDSVVQDWITLWDRTPGATPFQSPLWLLPWWQHFGTDLPRVATKRCNGELTGILPLYIYQNERKILPMGVGISDYFDVLGHSEGLLHAVLEMLEDDAVVSCDLVDVQASSDLVGSIVPKWTEEWLESSVCPVLALPTISKLARRKLAMSRNRAHRVGGWSIEAAHIETIHLHLDRLIRLHQSRWTARGEPGVLANPSVVAFWREAAPGLLRAGLLRLQSLFIDGSLAAVTAALLAPRRIFFYLSGFDEAHAFVSPGTILLGTMLEQAVAEGRSEAHFLRGGESYKYLWGAQDRFNWSGRFIPDAKMGQR